MRWSGWLAVCVTTLMACGPETDARVDNTSDDADMAQAALGPVVPVGTVLEATASVYCRSGGARSFPSVGVVAVGTRVRVVEAQPSAAGYYRVASSALTCWVSGYYLRFTAPVPVVDAGRFDAGSPVPVDAGAPVDAGRLDAGSVPVDAGAPSDAGVIVAPANTWTWVSVPESVCGNGTTTGFGVNINPGATDLFVYMMGGGACWNGETCAGGTATNITSGYSAANFASDGHKNAPFFMRTEPTNPFRNASFIFIPYCTGDTYFGDRVANYTNPTMTVHHKGRANMDAFIRRMSATFPSTKRVFVSGSSAGGFGAQLNYPRFREGFPRSQVHALADCSQIIQPTGTRYAEWVASWNIVAPPGCVNCETVFSNFVDYLHSTYPDGRFGLLAFTQDAVLMRYFGFTSPTSFEATTGALLRGSYSPHANAKYFELTGQSHMMLLSPQGRTGTNGTTLIKWLNDFVDGAPSWANVVP